MTYHLTPRSANAKTGPIPVSTTSARTCPPACPFNHANGGGCYASSGPLALHWRAVTDGTRGQDLPGFLADLDRTLAAAPPRQLWRHNQAGDLPGTGNRIAPAALRRIAETNARHNARGWTYTHKPMTTATNRRAVEDANRAGFTVNLSGNSLAHADQLAALEIGPVVAVIPAGFKGRRTKTPSGRPVLICPAQTGPATCATCGLCASRDPRRPIIGFLAHGTGARAVSAIAAAP
jgi:hypothetical protein